jgi:hypothetical protein
VAGQSTWGSRPIQAGLAKLGIAISDSTVRTYRPNHRRSVSTQTWKTFLHNHAKELVAIDFFTVPTAMCRVLYVFLVLAHERRKVLHFHITDVPSAVWTAQQIVEAFPFTTPPVISSGIGMPSMAPTSCAESRTWVWNKSSLRRAPPGKTQWSND